VAEWLPLAWELALAQVRPATMAQTLVHALAQAQAQAQAGPERVADLMVQAWVLGRKASVSQARAAEVKERSAVSEESSVP